MLAGVLPLFWFLCGEGTTLSVVEVDSVFHLDQGVATLRRTMNVQNISRAGDTLKEIEMQLHSRVDELQSLLLLRSSGNEENRNLASAHLQSAARTMDHLESQLRHIALYVKREHEAVEFATVWHLTVYYCTNQEEQNMIHWRSHLCLISVRS